MSCRVRPCRRHGETGKAQMPKGDEMADEAPDASVDEQKQTLERAMAAMGQEQKQVMERLKSQWLTEAIGTAESMISDGMRQLKAATQHQKKS